MEHREGILMHAQQILYLTGFALESSETTYSIASLISPFPKESTLVCLSM